MRKVGPFSSGAAAGNNGAATANSTTAIELAGRVAGIYVKYNDSPPATTGVKIETVGTAPNPPSYTLLELSNANTGGWFYPHVAIHDTAGAAIAGEYDTLLVADRVKITIAGANANDSVDVWFILE